MYRPYLYSPYPPLAPSHALQVEQLILQARDELALIPMLLAANAFDPYDGSPPEEILVDLKR